MRSRRLRRLRATRWSGRCLTRGSRTDIWPRLAACGNLAATRSIPHISSETSAPMHSLTAFARLNGERGRTRATSSGSGLFGPAARAFLGLFARCGDQDDGTVGLAATVPTDPCNPVRAAFLGVNLERS